MEIKIDKPWKETALGFVLMIGVLSIPLWIGVAIVAIKVLNTGCVN